MLRLTPDFETLRLAPGGHQTHCLEILRLTPDFKKLRLAGAWRASGGRLAAA